MSVNSSFEDMDFKIVYKPHEIMKDYNATYNVIYKGKKITNSAGIKLGIPDNEIWISEKWRKYEKYVLFHELQEIKFRALGYDVEDSHYLSELECIRRFKDDPLWREFIVELHISDVKNIASSINSKNL